MAETGRQSRTPKSTPTTPADYPTVPHPLSGLDHSFLLQTIMSVKESVGELKQSVVTLKDASDKHDDKLSQIGKDVHTAKITLRVVGAIIAAVLAFTAWTAGKAIDVFVRLYHPASQQQTSPPAQR